MIKRLLAIDGIYERIKTDREVIGLKTFIKIPTSRAKIEQVPLCFMGFGIDAIVKRSARTATASRKGQGDIRSLEVMLEVVGKKEDGVFEIYRKLRRSVLNDIYPIANDFSVYMQEERLEGPFGYGIPDVEALLFVLALIYPDEV